MRTIKILLAAGFLLVFGTRGRIIIRENPKYLSLNEMYQVANSYPKGSKAR